MKCVQCGAELRPEARFCPQCGLPVQVSPDLEPDSRGGMEPLDRSVRPQQPAAPAPVPGMTGDLKTPAPDKSGRSTELPPHVQNYQNRFQTPRKGAAAKPRNAGSRSAQIAPTPLPAEPRRASSPPPYTGAGRFEAPKSKRRRSRGFKAAVIIIILLALGMVGTGVYLLLQPKGSGSSDSSQPTGTHLDNPGSDSTAPGGVDTAPTETDPPETEPRSSAELAQEQLARMTTEEKIYQLFIVTPETISGTDTVTAGTPGLKDAFARQPVGGVIFFSENIVDRKQCTDLIADLRAASPSLLLAVDEEGGILSRVSSNSDMGATHFGPMGDVEDTDEAFRIGQTIGTDLKAIGFNLDLAPVADVNSDPDNILIGNRAFGSDPEEVGSLVAACTGGFREAGILSCLKHYPGHGDVTHSDYHEFYVNYAGIDSLRETEFVPFAAGINSGTPVIMATFIVCPNVTGDNTPTPMSEIMIQELLRDELGFNGLVLTDNLGRPDICDAYPNGQASVAALAAGCDLLLMPEDLDEAVAAIQAALEDGTLTQERLDESVTRILTAKLEYHILTPEEG